MVFLSRGCGLKEFSERLEVIFDERSVFAETKYCRRMEREKIIPIVCCTKGSVLFEKGYIFIKDCKTGRFSQKYKDLWADYLDLSVKMSTGMDDICFFRSSVFRQVFHRTRDIDILFGESDPADQGAEELSGSTDERSTSLGFESAGSLTDEHDLCIRISFSEDCFSDAMLFAERAAQNGFFEFVELLCFCHMNSTILS